MVKWGKRLINEKDSFSPLLILFMVKCLTLYQGRRRSFSPLLILFMVKFIHAIYRGLDCFSPLLILFMVKLNTEPSMRTIGFSPLLILFMVKYTYHRVRIFQDFCEILGRNIRFFAILMAKELTRD